MNLQNLIGGTLPDSLYQKQQQVSSKRSLNAATGYAGTTKNLDLIPELAAGNSLASSASRGNKSLSFIGTMSTPGTKKAA